MNEWEKNRRMAESYRQSYPPGTRLELIGIICQTSAKA